MIGGKESSSITLMADVSHALKNTERELLLCLLREETIKIGMIVHLVQFTLPINGMQGDFWHKRNLQLAQLRDISNQIVVVR